MREYVKYVSYKSARCRLRISPEKRTIRVIEVFANVRERGHGTGLMKAVCEIADDMQMRLILRARPYDDGLNKEDLKKFYSKFGFVTTKGDMMTRTVKYE